MKIRKSFVSNSSSTSFMIAFKEDALNKNYELFDFIAKFLIPKSFWTSGELSLKKFNTTVAERRIELTKELKTLERDWHLVDNQEQTLKYLTQFSKVKDAVNLCLEIYSNDTSALRQSRRQPKEHSEPTRLEYKFSDLAWQKSVLKARQKQINDQLAHLATLSESTRILSWEEDAGFGMLKDLVEEMEKKNLITVLEQVTT